MTKNPAKNIAAATQTTTSAKVPTLPALVILPNFSFTGALFNAQSSSDNAPIMTGSIELDGQKYPLAAFLKTSSSDSTKQFLSLSIGEENGIHYRGSLFRNAESYSGLLELLPVTKDSKHTDADYKAAKKLIIGGERRRSANGDARIALTFAAVKVEENELAF